MKQRLEAHPSSHGAVVRNKGGRQPGCRGAEQAVVRKILHHANLARVDAVGRRQGTMRLVHAEDEIGCGARETLLPFEQPDDRAGPEVPGELAAVEFGNRIMDVENHPCPPTPLRRCGPDHEIGNVVHMHDIDLVPRAKSREQTSSPIEEGRVGGQVTREGGSPIARTLPAEQHDAVEPAHPPLAFAGQP